MLLLIEKVGDTNLKLKEKAENTIMEFANAPLIGHKTVFEDLISGQVKKTLVKSAKHLSGRLNLISRMIDNYGLNTNDVPIDSLMSYAVNAYKDPSKEVRDAAFLVIMDVFRYIGDDVRKYFKELRQAQINALEEGFENLDGLNSYGAGAHGNVNGNGNKDEEGEFENDSEITYNKKVDKDHKIDKAEKMDRNDKNEKNKKIKQSDQQNYNYNIDGMYC